MLKSKLGETTLSEAIEVFIKNTTKKIGAPVPLRALVIEFIRKKESDNLSARYLESLDWALRKFKNAFQNNIGDVTGPEIDGWLCGLNVSARTRNNLRSTVQTLSCALQHPDDIYRKTTTKLESVQVAKQNPAGLRFLHRLNSNGC